MLTLLNVYLKKFYKLFVPFGKILAPQAKTNHTGFFKQPQRNFCSKISPMLVEISLKHFQLRLSLTFDI